MPSYCGSVQLDHTSSCTRHLLHLRAASRETRHKRPGSEANMRLSADRIAADASTSGLEEVSHGDRLSQYSRRPVRTPTSEDPEQLPAHRRLRPPMSPVTAQPKTAQPATRDDSLGRTQEGRRPAVGDYETQELKHSRSLAPATRQCSDGAVSHAGNTMQKGCSSHPRLQPYWSAPESGTLQGESLAYPLLLSTCGQAACAFGVTRQPGC